MKNLKTFSEISETKQDQSEKLKEWAEQVGGKIVNGSLKVKEGDLTITPNKDGKTYSIENPAADIDNKASMERVEEILNLREAPEPGPPGEDIEDKIEDEMGPTNEKISNDSQADDSFTMIEDDLKSAKHLPTSQKVERLKLIKILLDELIYYYK